MLSELPPGTGAFRWSFPARNRIMAGLARMTVVVEAADPSRQLITAEFARDLGRDGGRGARAGSRPAWPPGTNGLLRDGAVLVTGAEDVLDELFGVGAAARPAPARRAAPADPGARARRCSRPWRPGAGWTRSWRRRASRARGEARALGRLEAGGHIVRGGLGGWERRDVPGRAGRSAVGAYSHPPMASPPTPRACCRSPARIPAAAPGSRPT